MTTTFIILFLLALTTTLSAWAIRHDRSERRYVPSIRAHEHRPPEPSRPW